MATNSHTVAANEAQPTISPVVANTTGSDIDRSVFALGIGLLRELRIPFSVSITVASRTPKRMIDFAKVLVSRGN